MSDRKTVWCLGMQSSASTWIYNAALKVAGALYPHGKVETEFIPDGGRPPEPSADTDAFIVKTHGVRGRASAWLATHADAIIITLRDPRDAVSSLMEHNGLKFGDALEFVRSSILTCKEFATDRRAILCQYRDEIYRRPCDNSTYRRRIRSHIDLRRHGANFR